MIDVALTIAWRPFLDPLPAAGPVWWLLILPLAFGISVIYKAIRVPSLETYWKQVLLMTGQIVLTMAAIAVGLHLFVELVLPRIG